MLCFSIAPNAEQTAAMAACDLDAQARNSDRGYGSRARALRAKTHFNPKDISMLRFISVAGLNLAAFSRDPLSVSLSDIDHRRKTRP
jgi:hypothetical protein